MKNNNLVTHKLANPYCVINADGTPNKVGQITEYVWAYVEIGSYKTTQHVRGPLTHDSGAPPIASQHKFIVQPLVTKEWNAGTF